MKGDFKILSYLFANILVFYTIPLLCNPTGMSIPYLLLLIPSLCLITAIIFGIKYNFRLVYPLLVMLVYTPSIYLFYNDSVIIYLLMYGMLALAGNLIGSVFNDDKKNTRRKKSIA